ncbi:Acetyltransferase (GNAT) family protein [Legionella santicrucis]|uniref:Acetyltransferase (GNAT) family protein n=1 Tax=Legionella santicrucis TaxID=45074 RepID=A0A0W0YJJ7_9GAMM|nr:GNAT family N-acetyltransferase [Legionella santicrucis]KTD56750.1 Acetyltransferase (GNAT) family protein [Legionella santicrucis]
MIAEKAVLSMWLTYLKSLKTQHALKEPILSCAPNAAMVITGVNQNLFNSIILQTPIDKFRLIDELRTTQKNLDLPLTAWLSSDTDLADFSDMLERNFDSPGPFYGMLLEVEQAIPFTHSAKITIEQVKGLEQAEEYAQIFCKVFHFPSLFHPTISWAVAQYENSKPSGLSYIARVDGVAVGVCSLMFDDDLKECQAGGLYNACVLPEFRKMGIGTAMANHRVLVAKEMGLDYISILLMSDAMARGYCERLGFVHQNTLTPFYVA